MGTVELRNIITDRLSHIDDISFLKALKVIIENKVSEDSYKLSDYQKNRIELARQQFKSKQTISHEDLQKRSH